ncbi:MAG: DUF4105 domain-containing protein [Oligoflexia bacterium]|nr:DUF4105 domain-containing protein [Oligoflexia bacterium]
MGQMRVFNGGWSLRHFLSFLLLFLGSWVYAAKLPNPESVDRIELLFASQSSIAAESSAGHLILRLVLKEDSPEYALIQDDMTVGFFAEVPENVGFKDYAIGGVKGMFPTIMVVNKLSDTILDYVQKQNRDLWRYKLLLSPAEVSRVVSRLRGFNNEPARKYKFFTANCAGQLMEQLALALDRPEIRQDGALVNSPSSVVANLLRLGFAREAAPSIYSPTRAGKIAREERLRLLGILMARNELLKEQQGDWKKWSRLIDSDSASDRELAFNEIVSESKKWSKETLELAYQVLAVSLDVESGLEWKPNQEVPQLSPSHRTALKSLMSFRRTFPEIQKHAPELGRAASLESYASEKELKHRQKFSGLVGVRVWSLSSYYTLVDRDGRLELEVSGAALSERKGEPLRLHHIPGSEIDLMKVRFVISTDPFTISQWEALVGKVTLVPTKQGIFGQDGIGISNGRFGFGIKALHFEGDKWRDISAQLHWLTPQFLATIFASEDFRHYLALSFGFEVRSVWSGVNSPVEAGTGMGFPFEVEAAVSLFGGGETQLRANYYWNRGDKRLQLALEQSLGVWGRTPMAVAFIYQKLNPDIQRFKVEFKGRR